MQFLVSNPRLFPQVTSPPSETNIVGWVDGATPANVISGVKALLGEKFRLRPLATLPSTENGSTLRIYEILTQLLPFTSQSLFFWKKLGRPFASMLDTGNFSLSAQCSFLVFVYARVIPFMKDESNSGTSSMMTTDGSPVEFSWIIPNRSKSAAGAVTRKVRFAIEPYDQRNSEKLLRGSDVLDYYSSPEGGLGIVHCDDRSMRWRRSAEHFLYQDEQETNHYVPRGSRFFVGYDFASNGYLTLKAYYLPAARSPAISLSSKPMLRSRQQFPIYVGDTDFSPLRPLASMLDPTFFKPVDVMLNYFDSLNDTLKPRFQIIAMDCIESKKNRLKVYFRTMEGNAFSGVRRTFTLGGRNNSVELSAALDRLEILWNHLFPHANSMNDLDLDAHHADPHGERDVNRPHAQHPIGGLLYYYELIPDQNMPYPKVYLPVRHYCSNDLKISQALESFYDDPRVGASVPVGADHGKCWLAREVGKAFNHRPLACKAGIHTYITFGVKMKGWELTSYFSPEIWG